MSKHTPGPWRFDEEAGAVFSCDELIADINQKFGEEEPNARLIAAAPDLLAWVERVNNAISHLPGELADATGLTEDWRGGKELIAKAKEEA